MRELHVDSVCKSFGNTSVLSDIYFSCRPGEIIGLFGRNGSGKSTLLKIIFGSLSAESKFVRVNGSIVSTLAESRNKISYLPQNSFLPSHLKIKRIVDLFCGSGRTKLLDDNHHVKPFLHRTSNELSGGERRIIEILLILSSTAEYILIDEPFNGVEPLYREEIKRIIQQHSRDKGFVITDHNYRSVIEIATKGMLLHDGSLKEITARDELIKGQYFPEALC